MNIKAILTNSIQQIKNEEARELATIKERVMREKIAPFNSEIDQARAKAENELAQKLNADIQALQEQFAKAKQALYEAGEKKKTEYANSILTAESASITAKSSQAIAKLNAQINDIKE